MVLTNRQEEGLKIAVSRYNNKEPYTVISGYAGTGKSTLINFIIEALNIPKEQVCYIAYTGKAASVLASKGCPNARTAHKLLYKAKPLPNGGFHFYPVKHLEGDYKVIVVDEVSMLPKTMWELLLSHKVYVIALGDPGQLPPINKDEDNEVLKNPHVFLDEIMRQAKDSEIIRLSMWIREDKRLSDFPVDNTGNGQVKIFSKNEVVSGMYDWADQILCATNNKRNEINNYVRKQKGFGLEPEIGDKIISLRNHWEYFSSSGNFALTNGSIGEITYLNLEEFRFPKYITNEKIKCLYTTFKVEEDNSEFVSIPIDYKFLLTGTPSLEPKQAYLLLKNKNLIDPPFEFSYAYAITTHKAQGSQWSKVLVFEEPFPFNKVEHKQWLYTACTRSIDKLVIIKK